MLSNFYLYLHLIHDLNWVFFCVGVIFEGDIRLHFWEWEKMSGVARQWKIAYLYDYFSCAFGKWFRWFFWTTTCLHTLEPYTCLSIFLPYLAYCHVVMSCTQTYMQSMTHFFMAPQNVHSLPYTLINHHEKCAQFIKEMLQWPNKGEQNALYVVSCLRIHEIWNQCLIQLCLKPYWKKKFTDVYWRNEGMMIDLVVL